MQYHNKFCNHYNDNKKYYKQLYAHKFSNLEEMSQFLKNHRLLKLSQDKIDDLLSSLTTKEIEFVIKMFHKKKSLGPDGCSGKFLPFKE